MALGKWFLCTLRLVIRCNAAENGVQIWPVRYTYSCKKDPVRIGSPILTIAVIKPIEMRGKPYSGGQALRFLNSRTKLLVVAAFRRPI